MAVYVFVVTKYYQRNLIQFFNRYEKYLRNLLLIIFKRLGIATEDFWVFLQRLQKTSARGFFKVFLNLIATLSKNIAKS